MLLAATLSGFVLALVAPLGQRVLRSRTGWVLSLLPIALTLYFARLAPLVEERGPVRQQFAWSPALDLSLSFYADGLSLLFAILISGMGALVLIYSGKYLSGHAQLGRFYAFLLMFMAAMLGVVLADDAITLFVFWELTSISSFLLIGFSHDEEKSRTAALQALLVTSAGGLALLAGLVLMGQITGSPYISDWIAQGDAIRGHALYVPILLLVLAGAFTKSAQAPFHFWLPSAMEAPTPVSAYLHSATMVKAGVFLLARFSPALGHTELWFDIVGAVGAVTMVMGAFWALLQTDLKRILAYSTISVLGVLTMLLGVGTETAVNAAMKYLLVHALYKGALFLVAGAVDHETGTRDVSRLGGLWHSMPTVAVASILAALSMAGVPFFAGFFGKELLYEALLEGPGQTLFLGAAVLASILLVGVAVVAGIGPFLGEKTAAARATHQVAPALWLGPAILAGFGLLLGVYPWFASSMLLAPAASAVLRHPVELDIAFWHGFNWVLALSALTLALGLGVYFWHGRVRNLGTRMMPSQAWTPTGWYFRSLDGLNFLATAQTRVFQSGYLRFYVLSTLVATVALAGYALLRDFDLSRIVGLGDVRSYEVGLAVLIVLSALTAVRSASRLGAIVSLGVMGYGVALMFVLYGAPDLAMTQFLVDTLIVILFVLVFYRLPRYAVLSRLAVQLRDGVVSVTVGALMTVLILAAAVVPVNPEVSEYYARHSVPSAHGRNIVNVILVDFRSLDTLGEITVLAIAGIGVYALLRLRMARKESP